MSDGFLFFIGACVLLKVAVYRSSYPLKLIKANVVDMNHWLIRSEVSNIRISHFVYSAVKK